jgi:hypothetical protein
MSDPVDKEGRIIHLLLLLSLLATGLVLACPAHGVETPTPVPTSASARFIPSVWFPIDLHARRLTSTTDVGALVRLWTLGSHVDGGENVFGPVVGPRTVGLGWVWRFRDSSFCAGAAVVVETSRLFDKTKPVAAMPAVTLSYRLPGSK